MEPTKTSRPGRVESARRRAHRIKSVVAVGSALAFVGAAGLARATHGAAAGTPSETNQAKTTDVDGAGLVAPTSVAPVSPAETTADGSTEAPSTSDPLAPSDGSDGLDQGGSAQDGSGSFGDSGPAQSHSS
jgi:hypothetical protein